jgi:DNA-binding FadR family transcriptional regulator
MHEHPMTHYASNLRPLRVVTADQDDDFGSWLICSRVASIRPEPQLAGKPRGADVPTGARDIVDAANVHAFVGAELAARAAANISAGQLSSLRAIQGELETAYGSADFELAARLHHKFHRSIDLAADSPRLAQFMSDIARFAHESASSMVSGWPMQSRNDHRRVLAALERGDANRARMAMAEHFTIGVASLADHLIALGVLPSSDSPAETAAKSELPVVD